MMVDPHRPADAGAGREDERRDQPQPEGEPGASDSRRTVISARKIRCTSAGEHVTPSPASGPDNRNRTTEPEPVATVTEPPTQSTVI